MRTVLLSLLLLAVAGCCHEYEHMRPPPPPPIENEAQKVAAVESQLKLAETSGWDSAQQRAFSAHLVTLPLETRIAYSQRLARDLTFGRIKLKPPAPPPDNVPACPCGGSSCDGPRVTGANGAADRVLK